MEMEQANAGCPDQGGSCLAGVSQGDLAEGANVSLQTIKRIEALGGLMGGRDTTVQDIVLTLEAGGIEFLAEPEGGIGVMYRKPRNRRRRA